MDKYTWTDLGSSYKATEIICSLLDSQLKICDEINKERVKLWNYYYKNFSKIKNNNFNLPIVPKYAKHNGHIFYIILDKSIDRSLFISKFLLS